MTSTMMRVGERALRAAYSRTMAMPAERVQHSRFPVRVSAVSDLSPVLRRLTLSAPELADYQVLGADEYFGLIMPPPGQELPELGPDVGPNPRWAFRQLPEAARPAVRWYTIAAHRPAQEEVDVDVITHGAEGPGSSWVLAARVGSVAGFQTGTACYRPDSPAGHQVIAGDETAVPAISRICAELPDKVTPHVYVEVPDRDSVPALPQAPGGAVTVLERGTGAVGSLLVPTVAAAELPELSFAWVSGEKSLAARVRRHLVQDRGLDRRLVYHCAYWILGRPRG